MKNRPIASDWGCAELHRERSREVGSLLPAAARLVFDIIGIVFAFRVFELYGVALQQFAARNGAVLTSPSAGFQAGLRILEG